MHLSTRVFISATSGDLGSVRQVVKEALLAIDCHPVEQTNFPPDYRTVRDMLEEKIRSCQAVVHIVGHRYGAEPDPHKLPPGTPRRSYTHMEYDLARKLNKKLYVFLCATDFPYDLCDAETADKQALQHAHRDALLADERLRTRVATRGELENKVRELQLELQQLRQQVRRYARYVGIGITLLVLVLGGIGYGVYQARDQITQVIDLYGNPDQLAERMRANIRRRADEELQAARARGARWEEMRELERRRDVALDQVDELIRTIQRGLASEPDATFREASRILAQEGVDAALGYLASHQQDILVRVDHLAAREDAARQKKQQALEPLLLQANLHETNLAWDRALELYKTVATKAPEWPRARCLLGVILVALARYNEAEPHLQAAFQHAHDDRERALASNSLGLLYYHTNRLAEAEPLFRRALAIDEQAYGANHPTVAIRINNLAQLLQTTNQLAAAEPLMRRALVITEQTYGANHPRVATALNNLALLLKATNRLAEAEPLMRRALVIDEQTYGPKHPDVARDLNNLALLFQDTNRLAAAEPLMRRALVIWEQAYGANHPRVATALNNLALLLQATNRLAIADPL
jgi:tetratricopeptide (TPR) repeat protein